MAVFQNSNRDITTTIANGTGNLSVVGNLWTSANAYIAGNLTVDGDVTYINITELNVEDPIISMGRGPNNTPLTANDGKDRGEALWYYTTEEQTAFIGYQNASGNLFAATNVTINNEIVTINNYGNFVVGNLYSESITSVGNIVGGNFLTDGLISAAGNITGGNIDTAGLITATGNLTAGNINTAGLITAGGNITGGNLTTSGTANVGTLEVTGSASIAGTTISNFVYANRFVGDLEGSVFADDSSLFFDAIDNKMFVGSASVVGNIDVGGNINTIGNVYADYFVGNYVIANIIAPGNNTEVLFNDGGISGAAPGFTFDKTSNTVTSNLFVGNSQGWIFDTAGNTVLDASTNTISANVINLTGYITGDGGTLSNITKISNANSYVSIGSTNANVTVGVDGTDNVVVIANTGVYVSGEVSASGNVTGDYLFGNITYAIGYSASKIYNGNSEANIGVANGNANISINGTSNVAVFANTGVYITGDNSVSGNITGNNVSATIRPTAGNSLANGIIFPTFIDYPSDFKYATIQFYQPEGVGSEKSLLEISTVCDDGFDQYDRIAIMPAGYLGVNTRTPTQMLDVEGNIRANGIITATGNIITSNYFIGNGSQLTGMYSNTNVTNLLSNFGSNIISTSGNITVGNISATGANFTNAISITGNVNITGNINATGNINYQNVTDLVVGDPLIYIGANNTADLWDEGIVASYNNGTYQHTGLVRDHTDGVWKLFGNVVAEPTTVIDWANATYSSFKVGPITSTGLITASGNITGNYFIGNGSLLTGMYSNTNATNLMSSFGSNNISTSGNINSGNITIATLASLNTVNMTNDVNWASNGKGVVWAMNTDFASIKFYNTGDADPDSRLEFNTGDNNTEYFRWTHTPSGGSTYESMRLTTNGNNSAVLTVSGQISATGNITGNYFFGNGSQLTGLPVQYSNSNVAAFLAAFGSNTISTSGNITSGNLSTGIITASGNITGNYFIGNGSLLTGMYSNTNATNLMSSFGSNNISTSGNINSGNLSVAGNITGKTNGYNIGYIEIPQVLVTGSTSFALSDSGKHYYSANTTYTLTIPNDSTVAFNIGTAITIVQEGTQAITISRGAGVTLYLVGNSVSADRSLSNYGMATIMKTGANVWYINGVGLT